MEDEITVKGEKVETAVKKGLEMLGVKKDEVEVEILDSGEKRFLGLRSRPAEVRLILKGNSEGDNSLEDKSLSSDQKTLSDLLKIDNGSLLWSEELDRERITVRIGSGINFSIDGKRIEGSAVILPDSEVEISTEDQSLVRDIDINVEKDRMLASLMVKLKTGFSYEAEILPDPRQKCELFVAARKVEEIKPSIPTYDEVNNVLKNAGIIFGIKKEKIQKAIQNPNKEFEVAYGREPVPGTDARIEYPYKEQSEPDIENEEKIEFFKNETISVKTGDLLAVKHPKVPAEPGCDVFGKKIDIKEPRDINIKGGEGVEVENNRAYAARSGLPTVRHGKLTVLPVYNVTEDVDVSVGNIDFKGSVNIYGSIRENFSVKATGQVMVGRNVNQAIVNADEGIEIKKNAIGSQLTAGGMMTLYHRCYKYLKDLPFQKLKEAALQLKEADTLSKSEQSIIQVLLDTRFSEIPGILEKFYALKSDLKENKTLESLHSFLDMMSEKISPGGKSRIENIDQLVEIERSVKNLSRSYELLLEEKADVKIDYAQHSEITASGNIIITGSGAFNSTLEAGGEVKFTGQPGIFRGGSILAGGDVYVKELGSPGGSRSEVKILESNRITADKIHPNVIIKVGTFSYKVESEMNHTIVRLKEGRIHFY